VQRLRPLSDLVTVCSDGKSTTLTPLILTESHGIQRARKEAGREGGSCLCGTKATCGTHPSSARHRVSTGRPKRRDFRDSPVLAGREPDHGAISSEGHIRQGTGAVESLLETSGPQMAWLRTAGHGSEDRGIPEGG